MTKSAILPGHRASADTLPPIPLRIQLLGGFRVSVGSRSIEEDAWRLRKAASLVKLLALTPSHRLHREQVLDLLWPDLDPKAAANNLHHALHVARRLLTPAGPSPYLRLQGELLILCPPDALWIDVETFEAAASDARRSAHPAAYHTALSLYGGDLLPEDLHEEWAAGRREGLHGLHLALLLEVTGLYEGAGQLGRAIEILQRAVSSEPALEEAHAGLMRLYARTGQRRQALRQYEQLQQALQQELNTEPEAATQKLHEQIVAGHVPFAAVPDKQQPIETRRHNLPAALTSFVGREGEIAEVKRLLGASRLLTITGTGGAGKTRLALQVAGELVDDYHDGVWFVELTSLSDPALVPQVVASVLEVPALSDQSPTTVLIHALQTKHLLLVLDNCEHVVDACAQLVETLLRSCAELQVLATSRERLDVAGEVTSRTPPLSLRPAQHLSAVDDLLGCDSVRLFVERAQYRDPSFVLTPHNAPAVVQICKQVDGIPLAIELAAARIGTLSVEQIASRLHDALGLLTSGRRTARPGHQTLRSALDWSYDLLSEPERRLFNRLSVFAGGWTLEAAEAVGDGEGDGSPDVLDLLSHLVDKSLVVAEAGWDGEVRYRLLEPVRQYAYDQLTKSGEEDAVRHRHSAWFLALAERAEPELMGAEQAIWLDQLEQEHNNLRAALSWSAESEAPDVGLRLAAALWRFWFTRGYTREGRRTLEQLLGGSAPGAPAISSCDLEVRAKALNAAGALAFYQSDFRSAMGFYEEALALRREVGDTRGIAAVLGNMGLVMKEQGDYERAIALYEEDLALKREIGDTKGMAYALNNLGIAAQERGDYARAVALHEESLVLKRTLGDEAGIVSSLNNLSAVAIDQQDYERATALLEQSLALGRKLGLKRSIVTALLNLGRVASEQGEFARAGACYEEITAVLRETGEPAQGASCLEGVAELCHAQGHHGRAVRLFAAAGTLRSTLQAPAQPHDQVAHEAILAELRTALGDAFDDAWADGQGWTLEHALSSVTAKEDSTSDSSARGDTTPASISCKASALTRREREIAELVVLGLTNRQIADMLVIAERTVDTHVGKILGKLGISSRTEVAARLANETSPG